MENAVAALRRTVSMFGVLAAIPSDNGTSFVGRGGREKQTGFWTPALFENELLSPGMGMINPRQYHSQTNGKAGAVPPQP